MYLAAVRDELCGSRVQGFGRGISAPYVGIGYLWGLLRFIRITLEILLCVFIAHIPRSAC